MGKDARARDPADKRERRKKHGGKRPVVARRGTTRAAQPADLTSTANDPGNLAAVARALAGRRATIDSPLLLPGMAPVWIAPPTPEDTWRVLDLDADAIGKYPPHRLLELLVDLSPDVSRALMDFVNMCNPGWVVTAHRVGTQDVDPVAVAAIGAFFDTLTDRYGALDLLWDRLFLNTWLRGAIFIELVLADDARTPLDIATPDPQTVRFLRRTDPVLGSRWVLGQLQGLGFVELGDRKTVRYIPIQPLPGSPYGRPLAAPAIFAALFMLGVLHDIRRVVAQQGWPRIDIELDFEAMLAALPPDAADDPDKLKAWVEDHINQVVTVYKSLEPDDAYVHASTIKVNPGGKAVGTLGAESLGGVNALIGSLERMLVKALKTMPLIMGLSDGVSEANANRQVEIHMLGIRKIQGLVEQAVEWLLTLALQAQGLLADVRFTFDENRAAEALRDEQVLNLKLMNANLMFDGGYADIDEASQHAIGHNADRRAPRVKRGGGAAKNADPGLINGSVKTPAAGANNRALVQDEKLIAFPGGDDGRQARGAGD